MINCLIFILFKKRGVELRLALMINIKKAVMDSAQLGIINLRKKGTWICVTVKATD